MSKGLADLPLTPETRTALRTRDERLRLFEDHQDLVRRMVDYVLHRTPEFENHREDLLQAGFASLWQTTETYAPEKGDMYVYAFASVRCALQTYCRRRIRVVGRFYAAESAGPWDLVIPFEPQHAQSYDIEDELLRRLTLEAMDRHAETQPVFMQRCIGHLRRMHLEGMTSTELAAAEGCPVGTMKSRLHDARVNLRTWAGSAA